MIALAQTHNTPLMSSSALRFAREVLEFKAQEKELVGDLRVAVATGPNELVYYGIHAAELFYTVMGPGIAWVRNEYTDEYDIVHLRYTDGRAVTMQIIRSARYGFLLNVYGTEGKAEIAVRDANFFYAEQMRAVVRMIQTRENPIPTRGDARNHRHAGRGQTIRGNRRARGAIFSALEQAKHLA